MDGRPTVDEVQRLLRGYDVALDAAEALAPLVRVASRPRRWTVCEPLRRLPRSTIGTSSMVTHHVQRSTAALARRYARISATQGLTEQDQRAAELVKGFRESVPPVRWKLVISLLVIAALAAVRVVFAAAAALVEILTNGLIPRLTSTRVKENVEALTQVLSSTFSPGSVNEFIEQLGMAGPADLLTLAVAIIAVVYLVLRPLSPAFRTKRILFNLATTGSVDLTGTSMDWNVARSTGLYRLERQVFTCLAARPPREVDLDLWLSAIPAIGVAWWFLTTSGPLAGDSRAGRAVVVAFVIGLAAARLAWLRRTAQGRRRAVGSADPPAGFLVPGSDTVLEARSVVETAAFGAAWLLLIVLLPVPLPLPSPPWVRLVRERRGLDRVQNRAADPSRRGQSTWPALVSAALFWVVPPIPVAVHLTHLMRLQPATAGSARRARAWLVPVVTAAAVLVWFDQLYLQRISAHGWYGVSLIPAGAVVAVTFGVTQYQHNAVVRAIGVPLAADSALGADAPPGEPVRQPTTGLAHDHMTAP